MTVILRVLGYLRPYRTGFVLALGLVAVTALLEIAKPWPLKIVVDSVLGDRPVEPFTGLGLSRHGLLIGACIAVLFLQSGLAAVSFVLNRSTISIGQRMVSDLRAELVTHLQGLSLGFFGRRPTADLAYRVAFDTYAVQSMAMNGVFPLLTALILLVGMTAVMVRMNLTLALIFLATAPLLFIAIRLFSRRLAGLASEMRETESRLLSETERGVGAIHVVQAFTAEAHERDRVMSASSRSLSSALRLYLFETGYSGVVNVILALGTATVLYVAGVLALGGGVTAGDIIVFVTYLASLYGPINSISQTIGLVQEATAGARRAFEILDSEPEVRDAPDARPLKNVRGAVRYENVWFAYQEDPSEKAFALKEVSFEAPAGTFVAIVGPTGAGKTTLASLIPRFHDPVRGRITLDGADLRDLRLRSLRSQIGLVPQEPVLFPASLADNVRYGRLEATQEELERAIELAGVTQFAHALPRGLDTPIGPEGHGLSQGQMQRITIARALLKDPRVLILDEPTSALDAETEAYVMSGIERAMKERTTFVIAHRLSTVKRADLVLVLDEGRLVEAGSYESLRRAGSLFQRLHEAQLLVGPEPAGSGEVG
jgi:ATP-binding cassette subfamily B protein/subfamily B ATP-binding cassette protein MsbA